MFNEVVYKDVKVILVGDDKAGKTCLVEAYNGQKVVDRQKYEPTISDTYVGNCSYNGQDIKVKVWDTPGQYQY